MRELVLNHASLEAAVWHRVVEFLPDLAVGMADLVKSGTAASVLRMCHTPHRILIEGDRSLFDAYLECGRRGWREEYIALMTLSSKFPLCIDLESDLVDRLWVSETIHLSSEDGGPLLVCVMTDSIAVSFSTNRIWNQDRLLVEFRELLQDGSWYDASEQVDNLARRTHAGPIIDRSRQRLRRQCSDTSSLWKRRADIYPHLLFGPDVSDHLAKLNAGWLPTLVNRLTELDETAYDWSVTRGKTPPWRCKVTPESRSTMNHPRLRKMRSFRSVRGDRVLFEWHARLGRSGRIHLRFDGETQEIEVGYIGQHLPTVQF